MQNGGLAQLARALAWHARGHRFDPGILHTIRPLRAKALPGSGKAFFMDGPDPIPGAADSGTSGSLAGGYSGFGKRRGNLCRRPYRLKESRKTGSIDLSSCRYAPRDALQESVLRSLPAMLYRGRGVDRQEK